MSLVSPMLYPIMRVMLDPELSFYKVEYAGRVSGRIIPKICSCTRAASSN